MAKKSMPRWHKEPCTEEPVVGPVKRRPWDTLLLPVGRAENTHVTVARAQRIQMHTKKFAGRFVTTMTSAEFNELPDYSLTVPTGHTIGKRWKRKAMKGQTGFWMGNHWERNPDAFADGVWTMGEYTPSDTAGMVSIQWSRIRIVD